MHDQLAKAINLAKKTGDRLIVFDSSKPENIFVVLSLKDYENMVLGRSEVRGLTEDELLDKINRDIAVWKSEQDFNGNSGYFDVLPDNGNKAESVDKIIKKAKRGWPISGRVKSKAEEIIEEIEEDRQYLEELAF